MREPVLDFKQGSDPDALSWVSVVGRMIMCSDLFIVGSWDRLSASMFHDHQNQPNVSQSNMHEVQSAQLFPPPVWKDWKT